MLLSSNDWEDECMSSFDWLCQCVGQTYGRAHSMDATTVGATSLPSNFSFNKIETCLEWP